MKVTDLAYELAHKVAKHTEQEISNQLNDFISRGLILIETTKPVFVEVRENGKYGVEVRQGVRLVLKDKEYIEALEQEVKYLRDWKKRFENMFDSEKHR